MKGNALEKSSQKPEISMEEGYRSSFSTSTFQFANIRLTGEWLQRGGCRVPPNLDIIHRNLDDDEALGRISEKLGEITVDLWSVAQWQYVPHYDPGSSSVLSGETVHERAKKATTHCITWVLIDFSIFCGLRRTFDPSSGMASKGQLERPKAGLNPSERNWKPKSYSDI